MKTFTASIVIAACMSLPAFAGAGAPVPEKPAGGPPSGRPGEILAPAKCEDVWRGTTDGTTTLTPEQAGPVLANFASVDKDGDGKVSKAEFEAGCKTGMVQEQTSKPGSSGGGQTPRQPD